MKKLLSLTLIALLLPAFTACGAAPVIATQTPTATTEITTITTTELPTTITTTPATTQKPTTTDVLQRERDYINNSNRSEIEKKTALKLLDFQLDQNGIYYYKPERWTASNLVLPWPFRYAFLPSSVFDVGRPLVDIVYATLRVKFQYAGQAWMVQLWKGRYGLTLLGGEIAVLKKSIEQQAEHYWPAEESEELPISMDFYQHNFLTDHTEKLFTRSAKSAWWFNGFVPGVFYEFNRKSEIIMVGTITFPDQEMLCAFEKSLKEIGFKAGTPGRDAPETYSIHGDRLTFSWQHIDADA